VLQYELTFGMIEDSAEWKKRKKVKAGRL